MVRHAYTQPFTVQVDTSNLGLGAVLSQPDEKGHFRVIAYASQRLKPAEQKYTTIEKECLAVIWAIEHFRPYLEGTTLNLETNHRGLQWLQNIKNPTGSLTR